LLNTKDALEGFALVHTVAAQARIIKWDAA
jgi:hypothetical protein